MALLRGINVGGAKRVPMADLRALIADLGFSEVKTLLNSGNALFSGQDMAPTELAVTLREAVLAKTAVDARVTVLTASQVATIVAENPFANQVEDASRLLISVLASPADRDALIELEGQDWGSESFALGTLASYTHSPDGVLASQTLKLIEKRLGDGVTTRNMRTFDKLVASI